MSGAGYSIADGRWGSAVIVFAACMGCGTSLVEMPRGASRPSLNPGQTQQVPLSAAPQVLGSTGTNSQPVSSATPAQAVAEIPLQSVLPPAGEERLAVYHEVRPGETTAGVAASYGVPEDRLVRANGLDRRQPLRTGQLLYIPSP